MIRHRPRFAQKQSRGSGTYVVTTTRGLSDPLGLRSVRDKNALALDLVNVRLLLEHGIAEMASPLHFLMIPFMAMHILQT